MFYSPYALLYRKIPKCPKTFGHDCRLGDLKTNFFVKYEVKLLKFLEG